MRRDLHLGSSSLVPAAGATFCCGAPWAAVEKMLRHSATDMITGTKTPPLDRGAGRDAASHGECESRPLIMRRG
eukprot:80025-Rhodomonas_salina.1